MKKERGKITSALKAKVAIEEDMTIQELSVKTNSSITNNYSEKELLKNTNLAFDSKRQEIKDDSKDKILHSKIR